MKKFFAIVLIGLSLGCGDGQRENEVLYPIGVNYPESVSKNDLQKQYDNAVWQLYRHYFDQDTLFCRNRQRKLSELVVGVLNLHPKMREVESYKQFSIMNITLETDSCGYCLPIHPTDEGSRIDIFIFYEGVKTPILKGYGAFTYKNFMDSLPIHFYRRDSMWHVLKREHHRIEEEDAKRELLFRKYLREHRKEVEKNEWLYRLAKERGVYDYSAALLSPQSYDEVVAKTYIYNNKRSLKKSVGRNIMWKHA